MAISMYGRSQLVCLVLCLFAATALADAPLYTLADLGDLPGGEDRSVPFALNDVGQVVGISWVEPGLNGESRHAFLWDYRHGMMDLGTLAGPSGGSGALGVNNRGQVVGWSRCPLGMEIGNPCGFFWHPKTTIMSWLGDVPGVGHIRRGAAINDAGEVVGYASTTNPKATMRAYILNTHTGEVVNLGHPTGPWLWSSALGINNRGEVVGEETTDGTVQGLQAVYWTPTTGERIDVGSPCSGGWSRAADINERGQVVVRCQAYNIQSYLWAADSGFLDLGAFPGSSSTDARAVNNRGWVVGGIPDMGKAFLWTPETGVLDLNTLIDPEDPLFGYVELLWAGDINERGQIIAEGDYGGIRRAFLLTPKSSTP